MRFLRYNQQQYLIVDVEIPTKCDSDTVPCVPTKGATAACAAFSAAVFFGGFLLLFGIYAPGGAARLCDCH